MVNEKPATVYLALGEGVEQNTVFTWPLLQTIMASIMNNNNDLVSGILGYQFMLDMMVPQISKEERKTPEGLPF